MHACVLSRWGKDPNPGKDKERIRYMYGQPTRARFGRTRRYTCLGIRDTFSRVVVEVHEWPSEKPPLLLLDRYDQDFDITRTTRISASHMIKPTAGKLWSAVSHNSLRNIRPSGHWFSISHSNLCVMVRFITESIAGDCHVKCMVCSTRKHQDADAEDLSGCTAMYSAIEREHCGNKTYLNVDTTAGHASP